MIDKNLTKTEVVINEQQRLTYYTMSTKEARVLIANHAGRLLKKNSDEGEEIYLFDNGNVIKLFFDIEATLFESYEDYQLDEQSVYRNIKTDFPLTRLVLSKEGYKHYFKQVDEEQFNSLLSKESKVDFGSTNNIAIYKTFTNNIFLADTNKKEYLIFPSETAYAIYKEKQNGGSMFQGILTFDGAFANIAKQLATDLLVTFPIKKSYSEETLFEVDEYLNTIALDDEFYYENIAPLIAFVGEVYINELGWEWKLKQEDHIFYPYLKNKTGDLIPFFLNVSDKIDPQQVAFTSLYGAYVRWKLSH